ncbi:MAG TPA: ThuA domain-containing protein [Bryobacteraceae bacterium]|jgi:hypothetical protein|nr:ThuA domain-containing protein [Bryobacteraceae bacterium]
MFKRLGVAAPLGLLLAGVVLSQLSAAHQSNTPAQSSDPWPGKKKLLAIGDVRTGYQHDSVSHALATIERLGHETGDYVTYIRTDSQLITKGTIAGTGNYGPGKRRVNGKNLNFFDAIFFMGTGEGDLTGKQKADLLSFVRDDGKGFVGAHTGDDAYFTWPAFGDMMGGYFDGHPWGVFNAPVIVEDPNFPGMQSLPHEFTIRDEIYQHKDFSRAKVHVLARLDPSKLDMTKPNIHRADKDFPVAWAKMYGKGRVYYCTFGHTDESWDDPRVQKVYLGAIRWALGITKYDIRESK